MGVLCRHPARLLLAHGTGSWDGKKKRMLVFLVSASTLRSWVARKQATGDGGGHIRTDNMSGRYSKPWELGGERVCDCRKVVQYRIGGDWSTRNSMTYLSRRMSHSSCTCYDDYNNIGLRWTSQTTRYFLTLFSIEK